MKKANSIDILLVNKLAFLYKTLKYSKLELHTCADRSVCNEHSTNPKGGVLCFAGTFVQAESSVLRMKFCGKNPALRVAANRQTV